jgi:hypothetical protein
MAWRVLEALNHHSPESLTPKGQTRIEALKAKRQTR